MAGGGRDVGGRKVARGGRGGGTDGGGVEEGGVGSSGPGSSPGRGRCAVLVDKTFLLSQCLSPPGCRNGYR